jgi:hypothetical protein
VLTGLSVLAGVGPYCHTCGLVRLPSAAMLCVCRLKESVCRRKEPVAV